MVKILSYTVRNWSFAFIDLNVIYMYDVCCFFNFTHWPGSTDSQITLLHRFQLRTFTYLKRIAPLAERGKDENNYFIELLTFSS